MLLQRLEPCLAGHCRALREILLAPPPSGATISPSNAPLMTSITMCRNCGRWTRCLREASEWWCALNRISRQSINWRHKPSESLLMKSYDMPHLSSEQTPGSPSRPQSRQLCPVFAAVSDDSSKTLNRRRPIPTRSRN